MESELASSGYISRKNLLEAAALFLKLGTIAFGGPAAHIALMHEEVVKRRKWVSEQHFLDLLGATNLIPGPNSTEMAIHLGLVRAGWWGLVLAGVCFILPAFLIVLAFAWAYLRFGSSPQVEWLLYGVKPVIIAVILQALWSLAKTAVKSLKLALVGCGASMLYFLGFNEIALLFAGGLVGMLASNLQRWKQSSLGSFLFAPTALWGLAGIAQALSSSFSLPLLFFTFLKIGSVLYGSGYVLLAFLRADFVLRLGWLTDQQLIDAVAVGQVTPGPVFTTATFIGYLLGGLPGAVLATVGIFLPAFVFVALSNPLIPRIRNSAWVSGFLDGVNVASLGLMAAVTWQLGRAAMVDLPTALLAVLSLALLVRFKVNSTWLILGGGAFGLLRAFLG
ncbi:MAG: chromate efflux transporter [Anaerolineales bacterium]|nr:chromate efflux transporter [Anaerolineales bacterium]MCS7247685.1 chromate efflux transporter [Anaerolineales bacterium]MDW8161495.1 chromate efflux transporter [Anaerolineales bacterium]MDW8447292.1 chromate efflux transporter [Anaerolineales bacterium]